MNGDSYREQRAMIESTNEIKTDSYPVEKQRDVTISVPGSYFSQNMRIRRTFKGLLEE